MRFVDEVTITVQAGDGGDGCVAFRREAHVPRGGPAGGDGGRGGDVVFVADSGLATLLDLRYQKHYRARSGAHGQGRQRHGRSGASCEVRVPCGTLLHDAERGELLGDLVEPGQRLVVARGGRGGRGNARFATSTHRAPREFEPGQPGAQLQLRVELKVLADVGVVGLPNAGKSTLVARVSAARPRVADYPFTTLVPNLGLVSLGELRSFVIADIPGLVSGAHQGAGLGHRFLRHVERCRVLLYLVDERRPIVSDDDASPARDYATLLHEVAAHDPELAARPSLVALNKLDLLSPDQLSRALEGFAPGVEPLCISAATGQGVPALLERLWQTMHAAAAPVAAAAAAPSPANEPGHEL